MISRRFFCGCALGAAGFVATEAVAQGSCQVFTPDRQKATSADDAMQRLIDGNKRFVANETINCDLRVQVKDTASSQAPFATILGCIDSRVPPELVFDQKIGDLFAVRIAGNTFDPDILGSLEFATKVAGSRLICVLGHTNCGAIKGAIDGVELGNLTQLLHKFRPAIEASTHVHGPRTSKNHELVDAVCEANAKLTAAALTKNSSVLKELVDAKQLKVVAALHDLETGRIKFLS